MEQHDDYGFAPSFRKGGMGWISVTSHASQVKQSAHDKV